MEWVGGLGWSRPRDREGNGGGRGGRDAVCVSTSPWPAKNAHSTRKANRRKATQRERVNEKNHTKTGMATVSRCNSKYTRRREGNGGARSVTRRLHPLRAQERNGRRERRRGVGYTPSQHDTLTRTIHHTRTRGRRDVTTTSAQDATKRRNTRVAQDTQRWGGGFTTTSSPRAAGSCAGTWTTRYARTQQTSARAGGEGGKRASDYALTGDMPARTPCRRPPREVPSCARGENWNTY